MSDEKTEIRKKNNFSKFYCLLPEIVSSLRKDVYFFKPNNEINDQPLNIVDNQDGTFDCDFRSPNPVHLQNGKYRVSITHGGSSIFGPHFEANIDSAPNANAVRIDGPGVQRNGIRAGESTWFEIDCSAAGEGFPVVEIINPNGNRINSQIEDLGDEKEWLTILNYTNRA